MSTQPFSTRRPGRITVEPDNTVAPADLARGLTVWVATAQGWRPGTLDVPMPLSAEWRIRMLDRNESLSADYTALRKRNPHRHGVDKPQEAAT